MRYKWSHQLSSTNLNLSLSGQYFDLPVKIDGGSTAFSEEMKFQPNLVDGAGTAPMQI